MDRGRTWSLTHRDTGLVYDNDDPNFQPWGFNSTATDYANDYTLAFISFPQSEETVDFRLRPLSDTFVRPFPIWLHTLPHTHILHLSTAYCYSRLPSSSFQRHCNR